MFLQTAPGRSPPFLSTNCRRGGSRLISGSLVPQISESSILRKRCGANSAPGLTKRASGPGTEESLLSDSLRTALGISFGLAASCQPAKADLTDVIQAGSNLVQKDTIIAIAFGTAILALGAVTTGVIYLSLSSWNDKRAEKAERDSFEQALKDRELRAKDEKYRPIQKSSKKKKELVSQGEKKGFGR